MHYRRFISVTAIVAVILTLISCIQERRPLPPVARVQPKVETIHGVTMVDDYYWLRDRGNPEVIKYLEEENAYTEAMMKSTTKLQRDLYQEMVGRIKETDLSVPEKDGDYYYYTRTEKGKEYKIICRKKGNLEAVEQVILDENVLAEGHDYLDVGKYTVSPNDKILAYTVDTNGSEQYTVYFKNLQTGQLLPDRIPEVYYSVEWGNDNKTVFYTVLDEAMRPYRVLKHSLGQDHTSDQLLYHETDAAFEVYLSKTKSKKYLLLDISSNTTSEVRYLDADKPSGQFAVIQPRQHKMEYDVYHRGSLFYIRTNEDAPNFKVMTASTKQPDKENWTEFIAHDDSVMISGLHLFKDYLVIYERRFGLKQIRVMDFSSGGSHYVEFPEEVYTYRPGKNADFGSEELRFTYSSPVTPNTVYDYNMKARELTVLKVEEVLGGYDKSRYEVAREWAPASDGTRVPISLVYKKDLVKNGKNPVFLYGYGAYGSSSEPRFRSTVVSLLDRGFVFAVAHVRGGGEMGRYWYDQGMMLSKKNSFTDFTACAEHLIDRKYTSPDYLVASGGSAGGLLMGGVANMRPDLFKVVLASMPFVDLINTMVDASIPLTVIEYEEWGNPNEKEYFDYMLSYSPYDNVKAQQYPNMLITAGLNDARVQYWEPAKWTAKLRASKTGNNMLLLKTEMGAGHFGSSGRYEWLKDEAFEYAFVLNALGMEK